ncbi:MAG: SDR family NAD(P)-dependent oxidoreductase, partial [Sphingomonas sp.]
MNITGNTILITGGGSGIGRALAEALHAKGNTVIIAGRRESVLDDVTQAHPGMASMLLDIQDKADIAAFAQEAVARFPALNVVINNAGIMRPETQIDLAIAEETIATNLLGPIRLTAALLPHLKAQPR